MLLLTYVCVSGIPTDVFDSVVGETRTRNLSITSPIRYTTRLPATYLLRRCIRNYYHTMMMMVVVMMDSVTDRRGCSLVADDDVAVLWPLSDNRVFTTRRRRLAIGEAHQGEVNSLSGLRQDHPRTGHRRADPERPRCVAGDDAFAVAGHGVNSRIGRSEVSAMAERTTTAASAAVAAARDVCRYHHCTQINIYTVSERLFYDLHLQRNPAMSLTCHYSEFRKLMNTFLFRQWHDGAL